MALSVWEISSLFGSSRKQTSNNNNGQKRVLSLESGNIREFRVENNSF